MPPVMAQHPPSASKLAANILNFIAEVDLADAAAPLDGLAVTRAVWGRRLP
jgi:hypothetical protein